MGLNVADGGADVPELTLYHTARLVVEIVRGKPTKIRNGIPITGLENVCLYDGKR